MSRLVALLLAVLLAVGCAATDGPEPSSEVTEAPSEVTGVIVDIESASIEDIDSFTVRSGGESYEIFIADDVEYGFPLSHLNAHLQAGDPVRVMLEERDGRLVALSIDDA